MDKKLFGTRINKARKDRGLTAEKLAEACNINSTYLRQIEGGKKLPSLPVFATLRNSDGTVSQPTSTTVEAVFYRLADYEDTNREPTEIRELEREYRTAVNELCSMCGRYKREHEGACHGCRWKKPV